MKSIRTHLLFLSIFLTFLIVAMGQEGYARDRQFAEVAPAVAPPQAAEPPHHNPHPPQDLREQGRVDFAVEQAERFYGSKLVELRHAHVIPWSWKRFQSKLQAASVSAGLVEARPGLVSTAKVRVYPKVPELGPDEYMVHAYVKFSQDERWYHLDIILSETAAGHLALRGFYAIPMPHQGGHLPPGVVC